MRRPCSILVLCVLLAFGAALAVPAEDVPETSYDESEAVPYEVIPLFSVGRRPVAVWTTQGPLSSLRHKAGVPCLFLPARVRIADARQAAGARVSLALLCSLLC
jgi:hypothetical protein